MSSKRKARLAILAAVAAALGGSLFLYVPSASTNVNPIPVYDQPSIAESPSLRPWGEDLSKQAVDSAGVEKDLDGNASALFASDEILRAPGVR